MMKMPNNALLRYLVPAVGTWMHKVDVVRTTRRKQ